LQIMLDKGEENDWFASNFISLCAVLFVGSMIGLVVWELRTAKPIINLRLFGHRNFAICCFLMMLVGGVLNANTVLLPQFMQQLLGWTATRAGMALTGGGITLMVLMPIAGYATGKVSARTLAVIGFFMFVITFRYAATAFTLDMTFNAASILRVIQMLPIPFCFLSITTAAYMGIAKEQSNQVAGLINFVRNIGGSILIAVTGAQVTNRATWHQAHLQNAMNSGSIAYQQYVQRLSGYFGGSVGKTNSEGMALASIYSNLNRQAQMQGYQDVYMELAVASVGLVVLAFMLSKSKPEGNSSSTGAH